MHKQGNVSPIGMEPVDVVIRGLTNANGCFNYCTKKQGTVHEGIHHRSCAVDEFPYFFTRHRLPNLPLFSHRVVICSEMSYRFQMKQNIDT